MVREQRQARDGEASTSDKQGRAQPSPGENSWRLLRRLPTVGGSVDPLVEALKTYLEPMTPSGPISVHVPMMA